MIHFNRTSKTIIFIAAASLLVAGAAFFLFKSEPSGDKKNAPAKPALTVTTTRPEPASLPIRLPANGSITAWQEAIIGSETNGLRLTQVLANVGDNVRAGQVLATFAADTVQAEVAQNRASLLEAEANALDAAGNAEKARTLQASGALSEQQINQYMTLEKTARARLEVARATLAVQQVRLKQTQLVAPDSGVISSRTATVGAVVGSGAELFRMIRGGRLEWRAEVTSSELTRLRAGTPATVVAANGVSLAGKTRMVAPTVEVQTRSALVYVDLPPGSGSSAVKAGMFARGEFDLGSSTALTVPQQSLVVRDGFSYVFLLGTDSHVKQLKVQTGRRQANRVEVLSGLAADAELVAAGAGFLNDGDLVSKVAVESPPNTEKTTKKETNLPVAQSNRLPAAIK